VLQSLLGKLAVRRILFACAGSSQSLCRKAAADGGEEEIVRIKNQTVSGGRRWIYSVR